MKIIVTFNDKSELIYNSSILDYFSKNYDVFLDTIKSKCYTDLKIFSIQIGTWLYYLDIETYSVISSSYFHTLSYIELERRKQEQISYQVKSGTKVNHEQLNAIGNMAMMKDSEQNCLKTITTIQQQCKQLQKIVLLPSYNQPPPSYNQLK